MDEWHFDNIDEESDALALEQIQAADAMLMGRHTYEVYAAAWPGRDGAYADAINGIRSTLPPPPSPIRPGTTARS